jgi:hypothetical protein
MAGTFALQVLGPVLFVLDCFEELSFLLDELNAQFASLIEVDLIVLGEDEDELAEGLHVGSLGQPLQTLPELLAFLDLAQFLHRIRCLLFLPRHREHLARDRLQAPHPLHQLLVAPVGRTQVFLVVLDLLVAVLNHLLVAQQSLLVLLDDVLRVALQQSDL